LIASDTGMPPIKIHQQSSFDLCTLLGVFYTSLRRLNMQMYLMKKK
jgi:hypothetical protein